MFAAFVPLADFKGTKLQSLYSGNLSDYFNIILVVTISVGATIAVLRLVVAGSMYMGSDLWQNKAKVREWITDVFIGLFFLLSLWIVLNQINPDILKFRFLFPEIPAAAPAAGTTGVTAPAAYGKRLTVSAGLCAPNPIFGGYARQMSCICSAESGGVENRPSETDRTADGRAFSTGLYQINLTANWVYCPGQAPLDCPSAFRGYNRSATVRNPDMYNRCVAAANTKQCGEATAQRLLNNSKGLNNWSSWRYGNQSACI